MTFSFKNQIADAMLHCMCRDQKTREEIFSISDGLQEMASTFPGAPNTIILRLILGDISVNIPNKDDKYVMWGFCMRYGPPNLILTLRGVVFNFNMLWLQSWWPALD